jgi:hypothetical protein
MRCEGCTREETINLVDGRKVCNYCPAWLVECEARYLLGLPLHKRKEQLEERSKKRGEASINKLKDIMSQIFTRSKK